jgi:hypothetical protein
LKPHTTDWFFKPLFFAINENTPITARKRPKQPVLTKGEAAGRMYAMVLIKER